MIRIDQLTVTVTVEGDAEDGQKAFARLFDKFSEIRDRRTSSRAQEAQNMACDRSLSPHGGRN